MAKEKRKINLNIEQKRFLLKMLGINSIEEIDTAILKKLKESMKKLSDTRQKGKTIYKIWDIIMCVILASFSNVYTWDDIVDFVKAKEEFLKKFLKLTGGIPNKVTYERVFAIINHQELESILTSFLIDLSFHKSHEGDYIHFDGRIDNGSSRKVTNLKDKETISLNCLNAYSTRDSLCIGSEMIEEKSNEIPAIPLLINRLNVSGAILTWDALNNQKETIRAAINAKADYVSALKGNQESFYEDVKLFFDEKRVEMIIAGNSNSMYKKEYEHSHSCYITYEYFQTNDIEWYEDKNEWLGLKTIGFVRKTIESSKLVTKEKKIKNRKIKEKVKEKTVTVECRYYISSLELNIDLFSKAIRSHWEVENKLHWHLDYTFREDKNTTMNKNALLNLQIINKFILGVLERVKPFYNNISLRRIRNNMTLNYEEEFVNLSCYLLLSKYKN